MSKQVSVVAPKQDVVDLELEFLIDNATHQDRCARDTQTFITELAKRKELSESAARLVFQFYSELQPKRGGGAQGDMALTLWEILRNNGSVAAYPHLVDKVFNVYDQMVTHKFKDDTRRKSQKEITYWRENRELCEKILSEETVTTLNLPHDASWGPHFSTYLNALGTSLGDAFYRQYWEEASGDYTQLLMEEYLSELDSEHLTQAKIDEAELMLNTVLAGFDGIKTTGFRICARAQLLRSAE